MWKWIRRRRWQLSLTISTALLLWLVALPPEDHQRLEKALGPGFSALVRGPANVSSWIRGSGDRLTTLWDAQAENARLREELALIKIEYYQLREASMRSRKRPNSLKFGKKRYRRVKPTHLLARDPSSWFHIVSIDLGDAAGVRPGDGILNHQGVVGKVLTTTESTARALFLTDPESKLSVRIRRSGVTAVLSGDGDGRCRLVYLAGQDDVRAGDLVETASAGLSFPSGIPVGEVVVVEKIKNGLELKAEVRPFADLSQLSNLYVTGPAK